MKQKVALVLSGGGARGIAHIGVIEELESRGYEITSIAGTSMGSVVGGIYAAGKLDILKKWLFSLDKLKVLYMVDFTLSKQGLVKGDRVTGRLKRLIADTQIEDLRIPFAAVAVDLIQSREVVFRSGSMYEALRASVSIPTVFTPVKTKDGLLVDGGVMNNVPIDRVVRTPGDILVAVDVNASVPVNKPAITKKEEKARQSVYRKKVLEFQHYLIRNGSKSSELKLGYFDLISKTISLMTHHTARLLMEQHSPDILIEVSHDSCEMYDFYKAEEMVEIGRYAASLKLPA
jgi:NTE family protein